MFLKRIPQRGGRVRLVVYEIYRDGGRARQRTVLPLGYLDELASEHEDPVAWSRSVARAMTEEREAAARPVQDFHRSPVAHILVLKHIFQASAEAFHRY